MTGAGIGDAAAQARALRSNAAVAQVAAAPLLATEGVRVPAGYAHLPVAIVDVVFSLNAHHKACVRAVTAYRGHLAAGWPDLHGLTAGWAPPIGRPHTPAQLLHLADGRTGLDLAAALLTASSGTPVARAKPTSSSRPRPSCKSRE